MKFARIVFWTAGGIGLLSAIPMYLTEGYFVNLASDTQVPYQAVLCGLLAWQFAFFVIATDPVRYRPMMIPSMIEKFVWVLTFAFFYLRGTIALFDFLTSIMFSIILGLLFVAAYVKTPKR